MFNGINDDELAKSIYEQWIEKHKGTDVITGSKSADTRAALVDCFKNHASIMIATESGEEFVFGYDPECRELKSDTQKQVPGLLFKKHQNRPEIRSILNHKK